MDKNSAISLFQSRFGRSPAYVARAPGRVNLLGEHVDYNDGFVLPAAIDRATHIAFSTAAADHSTIVAVDFDQQAVFSSHTVPAKTQTDGSPLPEWAHYPAGVLWALEESGLSAPAMDAVFLSDVPRGSGLSSSASVEMAVALAWQTLGGWNRSPMERALLGQRAENQYVGVQCGIMDQFASACGVENNLLMLDCRSLEYRALPLPEGLSLVVADTTIRRKLTGGEYNQRRAACEQAVKILQNELPGIRSLRDVGVEAFNRLAKKLPPELERRSRHVVEEIERAEQAQPLLEAGDARSFGRLMNQCHISLRDLYEVSIPELDLMVEIAQALPGCHGARLTGAGFGGCTISLVDRARVEEFVAQLAKGYESKTGLRPEIYVCRASVGARLV
jgi:galactokinase